jgi:hypothetical protein
MRPAPTPPVIALHTKPELAEAEAAPGVYVAAQVAKLRKLGASQGVDCRWMVVSHSSDTRLGVFGYG